MNWTQVCKLARELPEVTEGSWWGTPGLKVRGKGFSRLKEDGANIVFLTETVDEQEALVEAMPAIFHITDHYRGYAAVLARLSTLTVSECRVRLERAWRRTAPPALVATFDAAPSSPRPTSSRTKVQRPSSSRSTSPRTESARTESARTKSPRTKSARTRSARTKSPRTKSARTKSPRSKAS